MRRNTREPDARGLPALLAQRRVAPCRAAPDRLRLRARRAPAAPALRAADAPAGGAARLRRRHLALAPPPALRPCPALPRLALRAARLLLRCGALVLVSGRAALPQPAALVVVAALAVP